MKKFNETIKVEVEVDTIADKLLASFKEDNPHRELITEHVIGTALVKGTISGIYNVLNGYTGDIDFKVGQTVTTEETTYSYKNKGTEETPRWEQDYITIGTAVIKEINIYKDDKVLVEFSVFKRDGQVNPNKETKWINHRKLQAVVTTD